MFMEHYLQKGTGANQSNEWYIHD